MHSRLGRTLVVSLITLAPAAAQAGPPLLCFPIPIGDARSLAWGTGGSWNEPHPGYDRARLAADTLALLGPQAPVLVRMETLRRAVVYASRDSSAARSLFDALRARTAPPAGGKPDPLAQFDLGYTVEAFRQTRDGLATLAGGDDGYTLVRQALAARGPDPEMEYAAALVTCDRAGRGVSDRHLKVAVAGAAADPALARTIAAPQPLWGDRIKGLRSAAAR
jgi:hypothetical protein